MIPRAYHIKLAGYAPDICLLQIKRSPLPKLKTLYLQTTFFKIFYNLICQHLTKMELIYQSVATASFV